MMDRPNRVMPECRSPSRLTSRLLASIEGQCHVHEAEEYSDQVSEGSVRLRCTSPTVSNAVISPPEINQKRIEEETGRAERHTSGLVLVRWMCTHYHALGNNRRWTRMLVLIDGCQDATGIGAD